MFAEVAAQSANPGRCEGRFSIFAPGIEDFSLSSGILIHLSALRGLILPPEELSISFWQRRFFAFHLLSSILCDHVIDSRGVSFAISAASCTISGGELSAGLVVKCPSSP